jgi:Tfp pilus assembly protein PilX
MATTPMPRDRERGNSLVLALIVMSALATLGSLTVVSVQSSLKASTNDRSQAVAMYAAESGAAYAMDFLERNWAPDWTPLFTASNIPIAPDPNFPANQAQPSALNVPFTRDQNAWFSVQFFNNRADGPSDTDKQIIIRSTGNGPQGSVAVVDWEVKLINVLTAGAPPPAPGDLPDATHQHAFVLIGWHAVDL